MCFICSNSKSSLTAYWLSEEVSCSFLCCSTFTHTSVAVSKRYFNLQCHFFQLGSSFGSMPLAKKISIAVRLAVWVPFENGAIGNKNISLELTGGLGPNPYSSMILAEIYDFAEDLVGFFYYLWLHVKLVSVPGCFFRSSLICIFVYGDQTNKIVLMLFWYLRIQGFDF